MTANASVSGGTISRVDFYQNATMIGTATTSPYRAVWANVLKGSYTLTAKATDNRGGSRISNGVPITVQRSPNTVGRGKRHGSTILAAIGSSASARYAGAADRGEPEAVASPLADDLNSLTQDIQDATSDFAAERNTFGNTANSIDAQLQAALYFCRADAALAAKSGPSQSVVNHLRRIIAHLEMSEDLMLYGSITPATAADATAARARANIGIGQANTGYSLTTAFVAPASLGSVFGDAAQSPLSSQTVFAQLSSGGALPYELAGASVTIGGRAVPVVYVSAARVAFFVPADLPAGPAEVIVASQDGYVSKGSTVITLNASWLMTSSDADTGPAIAVNAAKQTANDFPVTTVENLSSDKRTRLTIFATGISGNATNSDPSNDVTEAGVLRLNFAESVVVEAQAQDGRTFTLPVEFAGAQGLIPGLDQVDVVLVPQLRSAGSVSLTLIINGQRSNAPAIVVQ